MALALVACTGSSPDSLIASGKEFVAKNDHVSAVIQFKSALQANPGSQEARILLGQSLLATGDVDGAIVELTKALDDKAPEVKVLPSLSRALVLAGDYKKLVSTYGDRTLDDHQAQATLKANIATAWGVLGDTARVEAAIAASLAAVPGFGPAELLQARLLAGKGRFDEAAAVVDRALAANDKFQEAWLLRGEILEVGKSDAKGADAAYLRAIEIEKSDVASYAAIIASKLRQRDIAGARVQADRLRAALPRHPYTMLVDAQLAFIDRQYARARELVQVLLRYYPDHQGALILGGAVEAQLGSVVQAAAYLNKVLLASPTMTMARRNLAEVEIRQGQYVKALDTLKPLLESNPPWADALALAGDAELRLGHAAAAERYYNRAAKLDPASSRLPTAAAVARLTSGDVTGAMADLQSLSERTQETFADEALFAARIKRRDYDGALSTLDTIIKKNPGKSGHVEMRGRLLLARKDLPGARREFEAALKIEPSNFPAVSNLAAIDVLEGKTSDAIARLQVAATARPRNPIALMAYADIKSRNGASVDEVKKLYAEAVTAAPTMAEPRLQLIAYALRQSQFKDALQAAQDALAAMPWDAQILDAAGQTQMRAGDLEQAATTFRKLATAQPNSPQPYLRLSQLYMASGKRDQAESAIAKALEIDPNQPAAQKLLVDLIISSSGQKDPLDRLRRITQGNPKQPLGYVLEAEYHARKRNVDAAAAALREGIAKTDSADLAGKLYDLLLQARRSVEAERFAAAWIKQHPKDAAFEFMMSTQDIARGDLKLAEQRLRRVLAAYPNQVLALNNLAWVLVQSGAKGAVDYAQRAVDLQPDSPALLDTLALALAADKQTALALDVQKRAVELAPKDDRLHLGLAKVALQAGDKELARKELQQLQKLGTAFPAHAEVGKLMQGL